MCAAGGKRERNCPLHQGFRVCSHCAFILLATAIYPITTNGLYRTQWKCSHYVTVTTSPGPSQPIISKIKSQSQIVLCEWVLIAVCSSTSQCFFNHCAVCKRAGIRTALPCSRQGLRYLVKSRPCFTTLAFGVYPWSQRPLPVGSVAFLNVSDHLQQIFYKRGLIGLLAYC